MSDEPLIERTEYNKDEGCFELYSGVVAIEQALANTEIWDKLFEHGIMPGVRYSGDITTMCVQVKPEALCIHNQPFPQTLRNFLKATGVQSDSKGMDKFIAAIKQCPSYVQPFELVGVSMNPLSGDLTIALKERGDGSGHIDAPQSLKGILTVNKIDVPNPVARINMEGGLGEKHVYGERCVTITEASLGKVLQNKYSFLAQLLIDAIPTIAEDSEFENWCKYKDVEITTKPHSPDSHIASKQLKPGRGI